MFPKVTKSKSQPLRPAGFEDLLKLYEKYQTVEFEAGMSILLESQARLETPVSETLLFYYASDCFEGGPRLVRQLPNLILRGSRLAAVAHDLLSRATPLPNPESIRYLATLSGSHERTLRFLARIEAERTMVDGVIDLLGLTEDFRTYKELDLSPFSQAFPIPPTPKNDGRIHRKKFFGWSVDSPDLKPAPELSIAALPGAVSFGESSLIVHEGCATMPFSHFKLATENVVRHDSLFIALGPGYIVSRVPPSSSTHISGPSVSLASADSHHFGHFVVENTPRLRALQVRGDSRTGTTAVIDGAAERYAPIIRSWNNGIQLKRVSPLEATTHENLLMAQATSFVASDLTFGTPFTNLESRPTRFELPWELEEPARQGKRNSSSKRLALLRHGSGGASYRQLLNHGDVTEVLEQFEFRAVAKDDLGFDKLGPSLEHSRYFVTEAGASIAMNLFLIDLFGKSVLLLQHPQLKGQEQRMAGRLAARGAQVFIVQGKSTSAERQSDYKVRVHHCRQALARMLR